MLILHEYRSGEEFGIWPSDIRYVEVHGPALMIAHTVPVQVGDMQVNGPRGPQVVPHHVEVFLKTTEVSETINELQAMILDLKRAESGTGPVGNIYSPRCRALGEVMREQQRSFGNGPREEVKVATE